MSANTLNLAEVLDDPGTSGALEEFVVFLADYADKHMFMGHIDADEAAERLTILDAPWEVAGSVEHYWVLFQRHEAGCSESGEDVDDANCHCVEMEWYPNPVSADVPGAVAVTTVFAVEAVS